MSDAQLRRVRYFTDTVTGGVRSTPPTASGRALDRWGRNRAAFVEWWESLTEQRRDQLRNAAHSGH